MQDWYIGQKVVCINPFNVSDDLYPGLIRPEVNKVYTIRGIDLMSHKVGFLLEEIVNPIMKLLNSQTNRSAMAEPKFSSTGFRPVIDREMDISLFQNILKQIDVKIGEVVE